MSPLEWPRVAAIQPEEKSKTRAPSSPTRWAPSPRSKLGPAGALLLWLAVLLLPRLAVPAPLETRVGVLPIGFDLPLYAERYGITREELPRSTTDRAVDSFAGPSPEPSAEPPSEAAFWERLRLLQEEAVARALEQPAAVVRANHFALLLQTSHPCSVLVIGLEPDGRAERVFPLGREPAAAASRCGRAGLHVLPEPVVTFVPDAPEGEQILYWPGFLVPGDIDDRWEEDFLEVLVAVRRPEVGPELHAELDRVLRPLGSAEGAGSGPGLEYALELLEPWLVERGFALHRLRVHDEDP